MILKYLLEKEFKQMLRNWILPTVFLLLPIAMMNLVPRVATQEVRGLKFCSVDNDRSTTSRKLMEKVAASDFFDLIAICTNYEEALRHIESGDADAILEIEPDFEHHLISEGEARVQISSNAVNGVKGGLGSSYLTQIINDFSKQLRNEHGILNTHNVNIDLEVRQRYLYNVNLDYKIFMVPALIAMMLVLIVGFLPALNIVGEKEKGTIEQINVTPIGRFDFILSKLIPYWCVGIFILSYSMLLARLIWGFTPAGELWVIYLFTTVFLLVISSLGLIVSNYSSTIRQAALVMFFFLVIFILMSGLLTPIMSMPQWAQMLTQFNPLRHFIEAIRALYLRGSNLTDLLPQLTYLGSFATTTWLWAIISYKKNT